VNADEERALRAALTTLDRQVLRAMETEHAIDTAKAMGTPQGLRNLFPTNLVRGSMRKIRPTELQRKMMTTKKPTTTEPHDATQGIAHPHAPDTTGDAASARAGTPATHAGGHGGAPRPDTLAGAEQGDDGTPVVDMGPPPKMPLYSGPGTTFGSVDQLTMAATAHDADAVRAVNTRNEPPEVAQYKANLLQWLDDLDTHQKNRAMTHASRGTNPDDDDTRVERNPSDMV
jgi:hypothetical protein